MSSVNDNEYIICPFNESHHLLKSRLAVHLVICKQRHNSPKLITCPFDGTHIIEKACIDDHVRQCPKRSTFEMFKHQDSLASSKMKKEPNFVPLNSSENWDDSPDVPSYNPTQYATKAKVLRHIQGAPPSKRKEFRQQERLRLLELENPKK